MENIIKQISNDPENSNVLRLVQYVGFTDEHSFGRVILLLDVFHFLGSSLQINGNHTISDISLIENSKPVRSKDFRIRLTADMSTPVYSDTGEYVDPENIIANRAVLMEYDFYWILFKNGLINLSYIEMAIMRADAYQIYNLPFDDNRIEIK